jgi:CDP-diacylglycerol--glycerol-3-phosphate 3-phosphatidyltransferase
VLDVVCSLILLGAGACMGAGYLVRAAARGRVRDGRLATGEGALLGRSFSEAGYWLLSPLVGLLHRMGATPDAVTLASLAPAAGSGVALATGHFGLGALLAAAAGCCDLLDGALARRLGGGSDAGEALDASVDRYGEFFLLGGLAMHYRAQWPLLGLALLALLGGFMVSYATAKAEALGLPPPGGFMRRAERAVFLTAGATFVPVLGLALPGERAGRVELRELPMLIPLGLVAVLANLSAVVRLRRTAALARARDRQAREQASDSRGGSRAHG